MTFVSFSLSQSPASDSLYGRKEITLSSDGRRCLVMNFRRRFSLRILKLDRTMMFSSMTSSVLKFLAGSLSNGFRYLSSCWAINTMVSSQRRFPDNILSLFCDEVWIFNFFFIAALSLATKWVFFTKLFIADRFILYPPCIALSHTVTYLLMVVSVMRSLFSFEEGWPIKLPQKPYLTRPCQVRGCSRQRLLSMTCWYVRYCLIWITKSK